MPVQPLVDPLVESLPSPVVAVDDEGGTILANGAARQLLGDPADFAAAVCATDRGAFELLTERPPTAGPDGIAPAVVLHVVARDGRLRALAWTARRVDGRTILVGADTGEVAGGLEHVPAWLFAVDSAGRLDRVSDALLEELGRERDELVGRPAAELFAPESRPAFEHEVLEAIADGAGRLEASVRLDRADGDGVFTTLEAEPERNQLGSLTGIVASLSPEGAERGSGGLDGRLLATQKLDRLGRLANSVAGDLNNALAAILGHSELALGELGDAHGGREILGAISTAAVRAAALCDQLLINGPRQLDADTSVDLSELVTRLAPALRASVSGRALTETALADRLPLVCADENVVRQLLVSLVSTAARSSGAGGDGGTVRIATGACSLDRVALDRAFGGRELAPGRYAFLEVADDGETFTDGDLERALDPAGLVGDLGRGAVLASVAGAVRALGGALSIDVPHGGGTSIRVLLQAQAATSTSAGHRGGVAASDVDRRAGDAAEIVLVVDDEPSVRHVAGRMFERLGYRPRLASDGEQALALFTAAPTTFRVAMIDLKMPGMYGTEVLARMRAIRPDLPVVLASGFTAIEMGAEVAAADGCVFLQKPFTLAAFEDAVELALTGAGH